MFLTPHLTLLLLSVAVLGLPADGFRGRSLTTVGVELDTRIIGGSSARKNEFPYMCSLRVKSVGTHSCGGVLVDPFWIITAGHCVDGRTESSQPNPTAFCGGLRRDGRDGENIQVVETIVHPDWDGLRENGANIALLRLERPSSVTPAKLPAPGLQLKGDQLLTLVGWGRLVPNGVFAERLKKAENLPFIPRDQCDPVYQELTSLHSSIMCAGDGRKDACRGDDGSPLLLGSTVVGTALGQFRNVECGNLGVPGLYTSVGQFLDWIHGTKASKVSKSSVGGRADGDAYACPKDDLDCSALCPTNRDCDDEVTVETSNGTTKCKCTLWKLNGACHADGWIIISGNGNCF